jgi:hypothetical protein
MSGNIVTDVYQQISSYLYKGITMNTVVPKIIFSLFFIVPLTTYANNYDFKSGLWEITTTAEIIDTDAPPEIEKMIRSMANNVETECINSPTAIFEPDADDVQECKLNIKRTSSNKLLFEEVCTDAEGGGFSNTAGEMNLNGKTLTFLAESTTSDESFSMKNKVLGSGKHIGKCNLSENNNNHSTFGANEGFDIMSMQKQLEHSRAGAKVFLESMQKLAKELSAGTEHLISLPIYKPSTLLSHSIISYEFSDDNTLPVATFSTADSVETVSDFYKKSLPSFQFSEIGSSYNFMEEIPDDLFLQINDFKNTTIYSVPHVVIYTANKDTIIHLYYTAK